MNDRPAAPARARYHSYLLRMWSASHEANHGWQASLEDAITGDRIGFANLEELFVFLMRQSEGKAAEAPQAHPPELERGDHPIQSD